MRRLLYAFLLCHIKQCSSLVASELLAYTRLVEYMTQELPETFFIHCGTKALNDDICNCRSSGRAIICEDDHIVQMQLYDNAAFGKLDLTMFRPFARLNLINLSSTQLLVGERNILQPTLLLDPSGDLEPCISLHLCNVKNWTCNFGGSLINICPVATPSSQSNTPTNTPSIALTRNPTTSPSSIVNPTTSPSFIVDPTVSPSSYEPTGSPTQTPDSGMSGAGIAFLIISLLVLLVLLLWCLTYTRKRTDLNDSNRKRNGGLTVFDSKYNIKELEEPHETYHFMGNNNTRGSTALGNIPFPEKTRASDTERTTSAAVSATFSSEEQERFSKLSGNKSVLESRVASQNLNVQIAKVTTLPQLLNTLGLERFMGTFAKQNMSLEVVAVASVQDFKHLGLAEGEAVKLHQFVEILRFQSEK